MTNDKQSKRKEYENTLVFWFTILGVPFAISLAICIGFGLHMAIGIPISLLIALLIGAIAYIIILKGEIGDMKSRGTNKNVNKKKEKK